MSPMLDMPLVQLRSYLPDVPEPPDFDAFWAGQLGEARAAALQRVLDKIIEASLPEHVPQPASLALDGTGLESWGQGQEAIDGRGIGRAGTGDSRERPRSDRR